MGSPTIFSGRYTKLLTNKGILNSDGSLNQNDGPINYVKYAEFEQNVTTGWSLGTTGTLTNAIPTGTPTFGSGASGNLSIATSNVSPIRDNFSLRYVSSAATTAGNMLATDALTIDAADQAKVLTYKFYYSVVSGASNGNFSGTSSNSFGVAIWDVTNSAWIGVAGNFSMTQSSGVGIASGTFQTNSNTSQIRLVIYNANASAGAITLAFDDFFVGPQTAPIGPVVTDFQSYQPTISGFNAGTTPSGFYRWRRVGDSIHIIGNLTAGGTGIGASGDFVFSLPSGLSYDTSKITVIAETAIGAGHVHNTGLGRFPCVVIPNTSTAFSLVVRSDAATGGNIVSTNFPSAGWWNAAGDAVAFELMAPISGWSSQVQLSNDTDTRVVDFRAYTTSARTVNNSAPTIIFENVDKDSHGAYNASTGVYTVPVSGDYVVSGQMRIGSLTMGAGAFFGFSAAVDGVYTVRHHYTAFRAVVASSAFNYAEGSGSVLLPNLRAGQTIQVRAWGDNATATFTDGANTFCIQRISGPSVVAASETVACNYLVQGARAPTHAAEVVVPFDTKQFDTHNMASGLGTSSFRITAPVSGTYQVSFSVAMPGKNAVNQTYKAQAFVNGSSVFTSGSSINYYAGLSADANTSAGAGLIKMNAGEYIDIRFYTFRSDGSVNNYTVGGPTQVSFVRVGN